MNRLNCWIFLIFISLTESWDLKYLNISNNFQLKHVSIYYIRAFLCIITKTENGEKALLIEAGWPENVFSIYPKIFPNLLSYSMLQNDCNGLQNIKSTDIDNRGRLWVLDTGNRLCFPKVIGYDLRRKNSEIFRIEVQYDNRADMRSILVLNDSININSIKMLIALKDRQFIVLDGRTGSWMKIQILNNDSTDLREISSEQITLGLNNQLYIADSEGNLFVTEFLHFTNATTTELRAHKLGSLLDKTSGLIAGARGFLYYILPRYGAVVRWNTNKKLIAEEHQILYFEQHTIAQIFFGAGGSVWIALEQMHKSKDHCVRIVSMFSSDQALEC